MPKPHPPPTPGSSSDIRGKEGAQAAPVFNLPPNAFQDTERASASSGTPSANGSDSSYRPASPTSPSGLAKKRSAPQGPSVITKDDFALPPPPTRSRKIIQMKPRESGSQGETAMASEASAVKGQGAAQTNNGRRRHNSSTTAAGRKIARKTAHSLIERRRRSKMNEEFGVLKDMIPACRGQEMHKLAILQASIEYLRYLEQCVTDLKAQATSPRALLPQAPSHHVQVADEDDEDEDEDEEMEDEERHDTAVSTPSTLPQDRPGSNVSLPSLSQITSITSRSPSGPSTGAVRHYSISSASQASYSPYIHSNQASPAFGPQLSHISSASTPYSAPRDAFGLGSPALRALDSAELSRKLPGSGGNGRSQQELDQEATAALLMLNNDRRNWRSRESDAKRGNAGMSVKDLLSG